jgi:hypothetical protein
VFSDETVENAWLRSRSCCECERSDHGHAHRCGKALVWTHRGKRTTVGGWEALSPGDAQLGGWMAVNHWEILCWSCYTAILGAEHSERRHVRRAV